MNEAERNAAATELAGAVNGIISLVNGYPVRDRHKVAMTAAVSLVQSVMRSTPTPSVTFELLILALADSLRERMTETRDEGE